MIFILHYTYIDTCIPYILCNVYFLYPFFFNLQCQPCIQFCCFTLLLTSGSSTSAVYLAVVWTSAWVIHSRPQICDPCGAGQRISALGTRMNSYDQELVTWYLMGTGLVPHIKVTKLSVTCLQAVWGWNPGKLVFRDRRRHLALTLAPAACKQAKVTVKSLRGATRIHKFRFVGMHQEISQGSVENEDSEGNEKQIE